MIDSKMVHTSEGHELSIEIDNIKIKFDFISDKNQTDKIRKEVIGGTTLKFIFNNFTNALGEGILSPLEVGVYNGRKLYISFFVWTPDASQDRRIINYCLYLGKQNGK